MREEEIATRLGEFLSFGNNRKDFIAVKAGDNAWKDKGINAGDILIIHKQETIENGKLALTYEGKEIRLRKACYDKDRKITLLYSPNPKQQPIVAESEPSENGFVLGQVVEVRRYFVDRYSGGGGYNLIAKKRTSLPLVLFYIKTKR